MSVVASWESPLYHRESKLPVINLFLVFHYFIFNKPALIPFKEGDLMEET